MTAEVELLPLPRSLDSWFAKKMEDYALANVAHAIAPLQAEIETLRAEVAEWKRVASAQAELHGEAEARAAASRCGGMNGGNVTDTPRLYLAATGHIYNGLCPDDEQPNARDKECPACRLLIEVERGGWKLVPVEPTRDTREAARAERDAQQAETDQLREQLRLALRDAAPAVQGEPVAYIRQEDFEFILADDKSEPYGTRQAPVFSRKDCRAPVPLYASPQPPAQDVSALVEALELARRILAIAAIEGEVTRRIDSALAAHRKQGGEQ